MYFNVLKQETKVGTQNQESFRETLEEKYSKQAKGSKACDSLAVGVTLGIRSQGSQGQGMLESCGPPHPFLPPQTGLAKSLPKRATVIFILVAKALASGLSPAVGEVQ